MSYRTAEELAKTAKAKKRRRPRRLVSKWPKPELKIDQILKWADAYFRHKGRWPHHFDGPIEGTVEETWAKVNNALMEGLRGLSAGSSLANLLFKERGVRSPGNVPPLDEESIFQWAEAHFERTGNWPNEKMGSIEDAPDETWVAVTLALSRGTRGLPGGSSLAQLLESRGAKCHPQHRPTLSVEQILAWADTFFETHGRWPHSKSGDISEAPGDTWCAIDKALMGERRGLKGGHTLSALLNKHRDIYRGKARRPKYIPAERRYYLEQIVAWIQDYQRQHGSFPHRDSGKIDGETDLAWSAIDSALKAGNRGLPGDSSLAQLLSERFGVRNHMRLPRLTTQQILSWADSYHERTGNWPMQKSGPVEPRSPESWANIHNALSLGLRGLPKNGSLAQFLAKHRGVRNRKRLPKLSQRKILAWADAHCQRTGHWPTHLGGPIQEAPGETWSGVHSALYQGCRGFPGGDSLFKLLERNGRRKLRNKSRQAGQAQ